MYLNKLFCNGENLRQYIISFASGSFDHLYPCDRSRYDVDGLRCCADLESTAVLALPHFDIDLVVTGSSDHFYWFVASYTL